MGLAQSGPQSPPLPSLRAFWTPSTRGKQLALYKCSSDGSSGKSQVPRGVVPRGRWIAWPRPRWKVRRKAGPAGGRGALLAEAYSANSVWIMVESEFPGSAGSFAGESDPRCGSSGDPGDGGGRSPWHHLPEKPCCPGGALGTQEALPRPTRGTDGSRALRASRGPPGSRVQGQRRGPWRQPPSPHSLSD